MRTALGLWIGLWATLGGASGVAAKEPARSAELAEQEVGAFCMLFDQLTAGFGCCRPVGAAAIADAAGRWAGRSLTRLATAARPARPSQDLPLQVARYPGPQARPALRLHARLKIAEDGKNGRILAEPQVACMEGTPATIEMIGPDGCRMTVEVVLRREPGTPIGLPKSPPVRRPPAPPTAQWRAPNAVLPSPARTAAVPRIPLPYRPSNLPRTVGSRTSPAPPTVPQVRSPNAVWVATPTVPHCIRSAPAAGPAAVLPPAAVCPPPAVCLPPTVCLPPAVAPSRTAATPHPWRRSPPHPGPHPAPHPVRHPVGPYSPAGNAPPIAPPPHASTPVASAAHPAAPPAPSSVRPPAAHPPHARPPRPVRPARRTADDRGRHDSRQVNAPHPGAMRERVSIPPSVAPSPSPDKDPYLARKMVYENHFAEKIREQLTYIPGLLVEVNVELDPHLRRVETRQRGDQLEFQEQAPLTPEHVTVAIAVPNAYFQRLAAEHDSGQELPKSRSAVKDDEIRKIESLVMNLLPPVRGGEDPYPRVRVHGYSAAPVATGARAALAAVHSTGAAPGNPPGPQPLTVAHTLLLAAIAGMLAVLLFRRSAPSRQLTLASRSLSEPETTGETRRAA